MPYVILKTQSVGSVYGGIPRVVTSVYGPYASEADVKAVMNSLAPGPFELTALPLRKPEEL